MYAVGTRVPDTHRSEAISDADMAYAAAEEKQVLTLRGPAPTSNYLDDLQARSGEGRPTLVRGLFEKKVRRGA